MDLGKSIWKPPGRALPGLLSAGGELCGWTVQPGEGGAVTLFGIWTLPNL